ncbi:hypothetical protein K457DRAFT_14253 [Linnemannia elongata AG-77]|uniref:Uncharacterized protein n=1 Tax=Linnemannia elongata AG-77 TaxID=1314771 RepID=A0A197KA91_9FUNG|nr:hypothetical protein K457DRAFT_14253 [Linnemannia elongata AG-77]
MECLRNLPSKTNAFQTATYERVRTEHSHSHNKPFFATSGQVPTQILPSSDENLILAVIRQKNKVPKSTDEHPKRPTTPEQLTEDTSMDEDTGSAQQQPTPPLPPPRLYKRPRIALSTAAAATATAASRTTTSSSSAATYESPSSASPS